MYESPEAAASQHCPGPAGPALMLLGHKDWLPCHISTETTLGKDSFTLSAHSPPELFPRHTEPRSDPE